MAAAKLRNAAGPRSVQATALVHEAWVKLRDDGTFADRGAFFGAAARAMKDVLVDRLRARLAKKRGAGQAAEDVDAVAIEVEPALPIADLLSLDTALERLQRDRGNDVLRQHAAMAARQRLMLDRQAMRCRDALQDGARFFEQQSNREISHGHSLPDEGRPAC